MDTRRPVRSKYARAASSASSTFQREFTGMRSSRNSSSGACSESANVTGRPSCASRWMAGTSPTVDTVIPRALMPMPWSGSTRTRTACRIRA